jgi:adenylosuccinate synthase
MSVSIRNAFLQPELKKKMRAVFDARIGFRHSFETRKKQSEIKSKQWADGVYGRPKRASYLSSKTGQKEWSDSSLETKRFIILDASPVKSWTKRHGIRIPYEFDGQSRHYVPDLMIELCDGQIVIEEVKGWIRNREQFEAKCAAAMAYCGARKWKYRIIFEGDLELVE